MKDLGVASVDWRNLEEASYLDPPRPRTREERGRHSVEAWGVVRSLEKSTGRRVHLGLRKIILTITADSDDPWNFLSLAGII